MLLLLLIVNILLLASFRCERDQTKQGKCSPPFIDALMMQLVFKLTLEFIGFFIASFSNLRTRKTFSGHEFWGVKIKQACVKGCDNNITIVNIIVAKSHAHLITPFTPNMDHGMKKRRSHVPIEIPYLFLLIFKEYWWSI